MKIKIYEKFENIAHKAQICLEFPQTVIQKGICLPKEQSADFLKNSEWQFCD